eukprot:TRINITY_DN46800_c0_g1_i1.p1 TRINITY_DN46800_c0_g1~~TRINITY_DN46800_c0_g1_i1.p1  ORF type:complete len:190 (+),score=29.15 TRINITY_DN46800_c0_g1_i1:98-667(+)
MVTADGHASDTSAAISFDTVINAVLLGGVVIVLFWKVFLQGKTPTVKAKTAGGARSAESRKEVKDVVRKPSHSLGEELSLSIGDLHFGQPRCRVRSPDLEAMPTLIKCPRDQLLAEKICVAEIFIEEDAFWVAQGTKSNRLVYAMKKRGDVSEVMCVVVEGPEPKEAHPDEEPEPETYGSDHSKIQLIP